MLSKAKIDRLLPRIVKLFDGMIGMTRWRKLNELLLRVADNTDNFFFIEIGSNDGVIHDPLYQHIIHNQWRGILIEPVKYYFNRLKANYSANPNLIFENIAISTTDETRDIYRIREGVDHLPAWCNGLGSFYKEVLLKHQWAIPNIEDYIITEPVVCMSLPSLLSKHRVEVLDVLLIDTEGYDYEIVKQLDFARYRPKLLLYEHKHLTPSDRQSCELLLQSQGYRLATHFSNSLAYRA